MDLEQNISRKLPILSLIAMLLVMFIHSYNMQLHVGGITISNSNYNFSNLIENLISDGIARIAVPLFFLISGLLFFKEGDLFSVNLFINKIQRRIKSVAVPFLIWSMLGLMIYILLQTLPASKPFFNSEPILEGNSIKFVSKWLLYPVSFHLWFLQILFILIICSPILHLLIFKSRNMGIVLLFLFWVKEGGYLGYQNYFFEGLFFFSLGGYLVNSAYLTVTASKRTWLLSGLIFIILVGAKHYLLIESLPFIAIFIGKVSIIFGLIFIWFLPSYINFSPLNTLLPYTFWIYLAHEPLLTIFKKGAFSLLGERWFVPITLYFIAPIIVLTLVILLAILVKRVSPGIYKLLTGNR